MSDLLIRPVEDVDYPNWLPLWLSYNAFYGRSGPTALPDTVTQTTWTRFLDTKVPIHALVAIADGEIVGLAHYLFHASTSAIEPSCYLQDLFTLQSRRGQGIARSLIKAVFRAAEASGTQRLYWHTHETNRTAQALYDKVAQKSGFIVYRKAS